MEPVSVSALTKYLQAKFTRDIHLQKVKLRGELSNVKLHHRGHLYFTLKDEYAKISGIAFAQALTNMKMKPEELEDGLEVEIEGSVRVYEGAGSYQIYTTDIVPSGIGFLQKQYNILFEQYQQKGYFLSEHKKIVPKRIQMLGIITAEDGAAIEDMKKSIQQHIPHVAMTIFPTLVQGEAAPEKIAKAIQKANQQHFDALIVGRGGGSLEDLWAFNTVEVIEAIYASQIPIISAVGHEINTMLSDYTADVRVATPTSAIHYFISTSDLKKELQDQMRQLKESVMRKIDTCRQFLQLATQQLKEFDPQYRIQNQSSTLKIDLMRLAAVSPSTLVGQYSVQLEKMRGDVQYMFSKQIEQRQMAVKTTQNMLALLNPSAQLDRGYALVYDQTKIITKLNDVTNELLTIQLKDGKIDVKVVKIHGKSEGKNTDV